MRRGIRACKLHRRLRSHRGASQREVGQDNDCPSNNVPSVRAQAVAGAGQARSVAKSGESAALLIMTRANIPFNSAAGHKDRQWQHSFS